MDALVVGIYMLIQWLFFTSEPPPEPPRPPTPNGGGACADSTCVVPRSFDFEGKKIIFDLEDYTV